MRPSAAVVTLGCKTNQFESAAMTEQLEQAGYEMVDLHDGADLVIVNTCTVTSATDSQSRKLIRRAQRINPASRIVVTGCYAQIDPQSLSQMEGVALVIGNNEKKRFLDYLDPALHSCSVAVSDIREIKEMEALDLHAFAQRSRAYVQIQNGCNAFCSFCIIPYARGRSRSVALDDVINQVNDLEQAGHAEIVLTGIHIGQYGAEWDNDVDLLALLRGIRESGFSGRLRLGSIEPTEISPEFYRYVLEQDWICPHFHIPLQAGDDNVLKNMNRHYTIADYAELVHGIRALSADAAIGLDIISGFPGESAQQFADTIDFLRDLPFTHLHAFPYSKRSGTPAADMPDQVPGDQIKERARQIRALGEQKQRDYMASFIGKTVELIMETGVDDGLRKGLSRHYLPVQLPGDTTEAGQLIGAVVVGMDKKGLVGRIV